MKYGRPLTLKQHRQVAGYSQEEFANKVGVDRVTVWSWEQGVRMPRARTVAKIEQVLGIKWADDILMPWERTLTMKDIIVELLAELLADQERKEVWIEKISEK